MQQSDIQILNERFRNSDPQTILTYFIEHLGSKIALSSSLGAEDQVLTHMVAGIHPETKIFTLDTGRLFPETYDLIDRTSKRYKINIQVYFPEAEKVQEMVNKHGINLFYDSIEHRKLCCGVRKLEPLKRAFAGLQAWICGLRAEQSVTRQQIGVVEWDEGNKLIKINPLAHWTEQQVWDYIKANKIPYNPLHDKGYPSIGCLPCTRAVMEGEDVRAGRWWWENPDTKECGLHKK
ncbi:phosphoadenosine phosphosulfate reductase [Breznakibacter xylanolyticus]|uniref:Adenosine 5'-phosphosulfate reductase n=1 Tax=Breznakibacter xylanolyticus TaxID=990 RepID=A0A2W7P7S9_9BACT|nr:phosphoadenylyl-sulfate reductase [Breznakibacter xylanolyticus]MBN2742944.1 phosphoadenylyl-sulfate reductase [Marinilabiliaceae bacterium]PZX19462.1 phosphoadenosine phosphosulfate reductase [Breznakibacter xylanolyticus]